MAETRVIRWPLPHGRQILASLVAVAFLFCLFQPQDADGKRRKRRHTQPPLRILSITPSQEPYVLGGAPLDFQIEVAIPPDTDDSTILEVSWLITSPSQRHLRFLAKRLAVGSPEETEPPANPAPAEAEDAASGEESTPSQASSEPADENASDGKPPGPITLTLSWDGTDQNRLPMPPGQYGYVLRAKLLAVMENGPRTYMVSWKKKGQLRIEPAPDEPTEDPNVESQQEEESPPP